MAVATGAKRGALKNVSWAVARRSMNPAISSQPTARAVELLPRLVRLRDAPRYLGMDRNRFGNDAQHRPQDSTR